MGALYDLVAFSTTTTGTGTITAGSALTGLRPLSVVPDGTVISYGIKSGTNYETGTGTVGGTGTTMTRTLLTSSTGSLLNLSGSSEVRITPNAGDFGGGSPGGSDGEIQRNNAGAFAGSNISQGAAGRITMAAGTQTTAGSALTLSYTANNGAAVISGLTVNMTDTASASGSLPLDIQINGASRLSVRKSDGMVSAPQGFAAGSGNFRSSGVALGDWNASIGWSSSAGLNHNGSGQFWLNFGGTAAVFGLGGNTSAFPALKRSGTTAQFRLADDSGFADLQARNLIATGRIDLPQFTTATRPAAVNGAVIFDSDLDKLLIGGASAWEVVTSA